MADNLGLQVSLAAFKTLTKKRPPNEGKEEISDEERFYYSFGQLSQGDLCIPHSPWDDRVNRTVANDDNFYTTFKVTPLDKNMFVPKEDRVKF